MRAPSLRFVTVFLPLLCSCSLLIARQARFCGNHLVDPGEGCDDGNLTNADGCILNIGDFCEADCAFPACGSAIRDNILGEACDDGNLSNGDGCDNNCTFPACGNGILDPGEQCDDGNIVNDDACTNACGIAS